MSATRQVSALCLNCRAQWSMNVKKRKLLDWMKCPRCGELQGCDLDYELDYTDMMDYWEEELERGTE
jgi:DNA-directed RNA polymerase subunit RPC12/RpoP